MKVWAVCVVVFFGAAELYQWLQQATLPLPVYGVAGLLLAIASNSEQWQRFVQAQFKAENSAIPVMPSAETSMASPMASPTEIATDESPPSLPTDGATPHLSHPRYYPGPQLPHLSSSKSPIVSFEIRKPKS